MLWLNGKFLGFIISFLMSFVIANFVLNKFKFSENILIALHPVLLPPSYFVLRTSYRARSRRTGEFGKGFITFRRRRGMYSKIFILCYYFYSRNSETFSLSILFINERVLLLVITTLFLNTTDSLLLSLAFGSDPKNNNSAI